MDVDDIKEGCALIRSGMDKLNGGPLDYYLLTLIAAHEFLLTLSPFKVGDKIKLADTPDITERDSWGWLPYKHFLVKGATGVVTKVEANGKGFHYLVEFDDDSWIDSYTKEIHPRPPKERGCFGFKQRWLSPLGKRSDSDGNS